jgi:hypothetical protein
MKKIIISIVWMSIVYLPCFLTFCEGGYSILSFAGIDDGPYLIQVIGMIYSLFVFRYHKYLIPRWARNMAETLVRDE